MAFNNSVDALALINKYYADNEALKHILVVHSTQVRDRALQVVDNHPEWPLDRDFVAQAAMLHDIGIFYCNAPNIFCYGTHEYIEHGYLGGQLLRAEELPKHARVAERHTGTGISKEQIIRHHLPIPRQNFFPITLEEQIICYADKFYSKTHLGETLSVDYVLSKIAKRSAREAKIFSHWYDIFEKA